MTKYDSYKHASIDWLDSIPSHWNETRIKFLISEGQSMFIDGDWIESKYIVEEGIRYITTGNVKQGFYSEQGNGHITEETFYELNCTEVFEGDLIVSRLNLPIGRACIVPDLGKRIVTSVDNVIIRPDSWIEKRYLLHLFSSEKYLEHTALIARGATMQRISRGLLGNVKICIPPTNEQTQIAKYLDHKTAQIDDLIAKKQNIIELLQEERTALINQAVSKGLDPDVPMKDSGIEWLGEIPAHWESWKISHAFDKIGSGTTPESGNPLYHENGNIPWLNTGDLNDEILTSCAKKITDKALTDYSSLKIYPEGSLVIAMYGATIGKTALIQFETTTNQACCVFSESSIIDLRFLQYWFKGKKEHIINLAYGGGQPNISQDILKGIRIFCPMMKEQKQIVEYLDSEIQKKDVLIKKELSMINHLNEYKTALISEVVTGKVDVRDETLY